MHLQRLTALAAMLASVPVEKFNIGAWRDSWAADSDGVLELDDANLLNPACGTVGCAIGWACAMPEFIAQGLRWDLTQPIYEKPGAPDSFASWRAVMKFFDIPFEYAENLFGASEYDTWNPTPADVAARITALVATAQPGESA